jgi:hypothetical protein
MKTKLSKRELLRKAYANAAAIIDGEDYSSLFGDDLADIITSCDANEQAATEAQRKVVDYLKKRVKP